jgi:hypothetical protein
MRVERVVSGKGAFSKTPDGFPLLGGFTCSISHKQLVDGLEVAAEHLPVGEWSECDARRVEAAAKTILSRLAEAKGVA